MMIMMINSNSLAQILSYIKSSLLSHSVWAVYFNCFKFAKVLEIFMSPCYMMSHQAFVHKIGAIEQIDLISANLMIPAGRRRDTAVT